ncbi:MAG: hypothetical protein KJ950_17600 [Proteobacteria bacterium]|nr:hypothetical protein [Pseudomonadota bacterium]MBU1689076.1 hypothetical protein [Pseudomonadota bacterium]
MSTPLKKTISLTCLMILMVLGGLLTLWIQQSRTINHHQQMAGQTEKINFQFAIIREHIIESIIDGKLQQIPGVAREMEDLSRNLNKIVADTHVPDEYKLTFMNQIDIPGIILLLKRIENSTAKTDDFRQLNRETRILGERLLLFDRVIINYGTRSVLALQAIIIGVMALSVVTLIIVMAILYRRMALPIISLARQTAEVRDGNYSVLDMPPGCAETDALATFARDLLSSRDSDRDKVLRASRLASLGELTTDVAHEINNLSNGIINYGQILADESPEDKLQPEHDTLIGKIIAEGEKVATISSKLLSYGDSREKEQQNLDLNALIEEVLDLTLHRFRSDGIEIIKELQPDLPALPGSSRQIKHLFLNLLNNARYALNQRYPGKDEGKVLEVVSTIVMDQGEQHLLVTVTDHGPGIPPGSLKQVFEPGFSTKSADAGTGLGLSVSREIVKKHQGSISIDSEVDDHTTVRIDFPLPPHS